MYLTVYSILKTVRLGNIAPGTWTSIHSVHTNKDSAEKELSKLMVNGMLSAHIVTKRVRRS